MNGIIRINKNDNFFTASNEPFNDPNLSWEARGVMGYLLSKVNHWQCRNEDLIRQTSAGAHKVKRILDELKENGYIRRYRVQKEDGTFDWQTEVYESKTANPDYDPEELQRWAEDKRKKAEAKRKRAYEKRQQAASIGGLSTSGQATGGLSVSGSSADGESPDIENTESANTDSVNTKGDSPEKSPQKNGNGKKSDTPIADAIFDTCFIVQDTMTPRLAKEVGRSAASLFKANATPAEVRGFLEFFQVEDWRGRQGETPTPTLICELWGKYKHWLAKGHTNANGHNSRATRLKSNEEREAYQQRQAELATAHA